MKSSTYEPGLNLLSGCEDEDTFSLRQLFVEELLRGKDKYSGVLSETTGTLTDRANEFKIRGVFDREIGDLTMNVCCNSECVNIPDHNHNFKPLHSGRSFRTRSVFI